MPNDLEQLTLFPGMGDGGGKPPRRPPPPPSGMITLAEARATLFAKHEEGSSCPCCDQNVKLYKRKLNSNMVKFLISLVEIWEKTNDWVDYRKCKFRGRDYNYLTSWNLARTPLSSDSRKRTSGLWMPTRKGVSFVNEKISVPSHVFTYNKETVKFSDGKTDVRTAYGDDYNFSEMMAATPEVP